MSGNLYPVFGLHGSLYGINADFVREICWLPELYSLATTPADIIGIFNWRSRMVPVMHLDLRFGRQFSGCNVTDRVIVVEIQGTYLGIVAHDVFDVQQLDVQPLDLTLIHSRQAPADRHFILGIGQSNQQPVACLDLDRLVREPDVAALSESPAAISGAGADFYSRCCPQATVAERATFETRALQLKQAVVQTQRVTSEEGVLVVQIGTEQIGLPLALVVDVDALDRFVLSPVPLAPRHILGQINWRGQILPLLELGTVLQMSPLPRQELVVLQIDDFQVGIGVDRVFDVFYLASTQIDPLPIASTSQLRKYLRGVTKYADKSLYLVEIKELIDREFLAVV
ncbi:chemotaxis protein CheW [Chamaesiphon sp.]|uniref:chemotaxis protein CheW n=1 Tax=Chamaesiphon sp. TaxID=2814140 RepID=UPI003592EB33